MKVVDFDYTLPEELIAQHPIENRSSSRLMCLDKNNGAIEHKVFTDIKYYLRKGDTLVLNDTRVIPARIYGRKEGLERDAEILLLKKVKGDDWECLVKPGRKLPVGSKVLIKEGVLEAEVIDVLEDGNRIIRFIYEGIFLEILNEVGLMPLPPYIKENLKEKERYQTVYSKIPGSAAAPTAGLHFTEELLSEIKEMGVNICYITLHVGLGTFRPVKVDNIEEHIMHSEFYTITKEAADVINETKKNGRKVVAVGTTSVRTLESAADDDGMIKACERDTQIFIYPGYKFKVVDGIITNFHLPKSTLLMLVSAFSAREYIMNAYNAAIKERYRFFSFGDAMYIGDLYEK